MVRIRSAAVSDDAKSDSAASFRVFPTRARAATDRRKQSLERLRRGLFDRFGSRLPSFLRPQKRRRGPNRRLTDEERESEGGECGRRREGEQPEGEHRRHSGEKHGGARAAVVGPRREKDPVVDAEPEEQHAAQSREERHRDRMPAVRRPAVDFMHIIFNVWSS